MHLDQHHKTLIAPYTDVVACEFLRESEIQGDLEGFFQIIWFWTGPGADLDVLRDWIIFDGFFVFYVFFICFPMFF